MRVCVGEREGQIERERGVDRGIERGPLSFCCAPKEEQHEKEMNRRVRCRAKREQLMKI